MAYQTLKAPLNALSQIPFSRPPTPHAQPLRIGFCGIGAMGRLMARNLANHQSEGAPALLIYNRTVLKAQSLASELGSQKIRVALRPEQLVLDCDVIITSLPNDGAVKSVYGAFAEALKDTHYERHKIFVETSTIHPTLSGELHTLITGPHTHFITSPVFGPPAAADAAQLIIAMAGDVRAKREVAYLFVPAIAKKVFDLGGNVEKAPTMKLLGNSLFIGSIELMGEVMTLAEKSGIGAEHVEHLINEIFPAPWWTLYSNKIANSKFDGTKGFHLEGGIKDASHIQSISTTHNSPMPVIDIAHQHMLTARALHAAQGDEARFPILDWSALAAGSRVAAGLNGLDSSTVSATMARGLEGSPELIIQNRIRKS